MYSRFPSAYDDDNNLFVVHDSLKLTLARDYNPGDDRIFVYEDELINKFPPTGTITLTDQVSDSKERSISFLYGFHDKTSFRKLELLPPYNDIFKPKGLTVVSQNVMALHRNSLKNAIISIEEVLGTKGANNNTLMGRLNNLRKVILAPKAWFTVSDELGLVPFTVTFISNNNSTDGGLNVYEWDFGDGTEISYQPEIVKVFNKPGIYDISLKVTNDFGSDTVTLPKLIKVKAKAPEEAEITIKPKDSQIMLSDKKIRTLSAQSVALEVLQGESKNKPGFAFSGELLKKHEPVDPILTYNWILADDMSHDTSNKTVASFSIGGIYDITLKVNTKYGSFRVTNYEKAIDVVEPVNIWFWLFTGKSSVTAYEMGLLSESIKIKNNNINYLNINSDFLTNETEKKEFYRNCGVASKNNKAILYWATGRDKSDNPNKEKVEFIEYDWFFDKYKNLNSIDRSWNWASFINKTDIYIFLGSTYRNNFTNPDKTRINLDKFTFHNETMQYMSGADRVMYNSLQDFNIYRTAWKNNIGYMLRSETSGNYYNLKTFYRTDGVIASPFTRLKRIIDMPGSPRSDGVLVNMARGIYFFNNSPNINIYNASSGVWETNYSAISASSFRNCQDRTVNNFDKEDNSLFAASDDNYKAYLSFDYSNSALMKYDSSESTFSCLKQRPIGKQWQIGII